MNFSLSLKQILALLVFSLLLKQSVAAQIAEIGGHLKLQNVAQSSAENHVLVLNSDSIISKRSLTDIMNEIVPEGVMIFSDMDNNTLLTNGDFVKVFDATPVLRERGTLSVPFGSWANIVDFTSTQQEMYQRQNFSYVWTGTELIIWGGEFSNNTYLNTGARYNPATNVWTPTSTIGAPIGRAYHSAVWTGSEMIIWGGYVPGIGYVSEGYKYNPVTDVWSVISMTNAPSPRFENSAIWTGIEMIIWGGYLPSTNDIYYSNGARYNPTTNTWTVMSNTNAPLARTQHGTVFMGNEMVVWGGRGNNYVNLMDGKKYNIISNSWTNINDNPFGPILGKVHAFLAQGDLLVYGVSESNGYIGSRYNFQNGIWSTIPTNTNLDSRVKFSVVGTNNEMIVWGGSDIFYPFTKLNTGYKYQFSTNTWIPTSISNCPIARSLHSAVWTGSGMIIWGEFPSGKMYNPNDLGFGPNTTVNQYIYKKD